jgi:hypothetical protein
LEPSFPEESQAVFNAFRYASAGGELLDGVCYKLLELKRDNPQAFQTIQREAEEVIAFAESIGHHIQLRN